MRSLQDRIFQEAFKAKRWRLLERQRVDAILAERSFQEASACSTSCASKIGSLLGVRTLLVPEFDRVDGISHVSLRELDVASGEVLRLAEVETDEPLSSSSRRIAHLLVGRLLDDPSTPASDSGFISIATTPSTDIWIDGIAVGKSPLTVSAWPGTHRVATIPGQTIPLPPKTEPVDPDVSATTIVIIHDDDHDHPGPRHPHWRGHRHDPHGDGPGPRRDLSPGPQGSHGDDGTAAITTGAVAAVAGVALIAAATTMPDSVWSQTWQDVNVKTADTVQTRFDRVENDGKEVVGILGVAVLVIGVLVAAIVLQN